MPLRFLKSIFRPGKPRKYASDFAWLQAKPCPTCKKINHCWDPCKKYETWRVKKPWITA